MSTATNGVIFVFQYLILSLSVATLMIIKMWSLMGIIEVSVFVRCIRKVVFHFDTILQH